MALDLLKLGYNTYRDLVENHSPYEITEMSVKEAFDSVLRYHGIIGFTDFILKTLEEIKQAEVPR